MYRDSQLLKLAQGQPCLLRIPFVCIHDQATTVACHSNQLAHGKGRGLKAHDYMSVWGCHACHSWLDQGPALRQEKVDAFDLGHKRQVKQWRWMAQNMVCPAARAIEAFESQH